SSQCQSSPC
ncbi:hypothetical protein CFC21_084214, partial [Triticum aestivum]